jgi:hypothetical protein
MALMVKELQDEHIVSIKVSGFFYKRLKGFLMRVMSKHDQSFIQDFIKHENDLENFFKSSEEAFDLETLLIIIKEIEKASIDQKQYADKEVLEPGDEGYVEPTSEG